MTIYTSTQARTNFFHLIDEASNTHEPIYIKGKRNDAVILSKEDYESMQETLYINSVPNLVKKITDASQESLKNCVKHKDAWK